MEAISTRFQLCLPWMFVALGVLVGARWRRSRGPSRAV